MGEDSNFPTGHDEDFGEMIDRRPGPTSEELYPKHP
jgi:hypothetical protein